MKVLVTGAAGFIGFWLCSGLRNNGVEVVGIDNLNSYYNRELKLARLAGLGHDFAFHEMDIADTKAVMELMKREMVTHVVHLAAQAGVRYSIENPFSYEHSNLFGFLSMLECVRHNPVKHFIYASSSSIYGADTPVPFHENALTDKPVSLYAATKKSNELMASAYARLYNLRCTGLRFFTVYGPWGRPDMAPMLFAKSMLEGKAIKVFNNGKMHRDFTYVGDIVEGIMKLLPEAPAAGENDIYNIGHGSPVDLMEFIHTLESKLGVVAKMEFLPMQPGDVPVTYADTRKLEEKVGYRPQTDLATGLQAFAEWATGDGRKYIDQS